MEIKLPFLCSPARKGTSLLFSGRSLNRTQQAEQNKLQNQWTTCIVMRSSCSDWSWYRSPEVLPNCKIFWSLASIRFSTMVFYGRQHKCHVHTHLILQSIHVNHSHGNLDNDKTQNVPDRATSFLYFQNISSSTFRSFGVLEISNSCIAFFDPDFQLLVISFFV